MTWKEIKDKIEELGVTDEDTIIYIDISYSLDRINVDKSSKEESHAGGAKGNYLIWN